MKNRWLLSPQDCPGFLKNEVIHHMEKGTIHHAEHLWVEIPERYALVNITELVERCINRSKVEDGLCLVSAMHITAGVYVNDAEQGLLEDLSVFDGQRKKRILVKVMGI